MSDVAVTERDSPPAGFKAGFWALIGTQFQGAFNDNVYKQLIILYLPVLMANPKVPVTALAWLIFNIPWLLFPAFAGAVADRFSKQTVTVWMKYLEVLVMGLGLVAFFFQSPLFVWVVLFLMASQSTFFSPAKYGLLPEILPESRLSWGNGVLQLWTFVAVILGTAAAGPLLDILKDRIYWASVVLVSLSLVGVLTSHFITKPRPADPARRFPVSPWSGMGRYFKLFWADRWLFLTMLGLAYFWFAGVLAMMNIIEFGKATATDELGNAVGGWATRISLLSTSLALGIGVGSLGAGYLSGRKIEVGLVPLGALGLSGVAALLALPGFSYGATLGLLFALGFFAGLYDVPLAATLQERSPDDVKGGMIATSNFVSFVGMTLAAALFMLLFNVLGFSTYKVFLVISILTLVVGIYICVLLPVFLLRLVLWLLAHSLYTTRVLGLENIPSKGGALLVANHTSFIDALVILATTDRQVRFVMSQDIYEVPWIRPLARATGAIPISAEGGPQGVLRSLRAATEAIQAGELVCIFAEGQVTRTGQLLPFRRGFERIMKGVDAQIIPVYLDRLWGSVFSYSGGRFVWKRPRRIPFPITVSYGAPLAPDSTGHTVRRMVQELGTETYEKRKRGEPLLHREFIRVARRQPFSMAIADGQIPKLGYLRTLAGSIALAGKLRALLGKEPMTGVLLPPSVGGALTNIALQLMGKVPINLNYTASAEALASAARRCDIRHVITARAFLERFPLTVPGEAIYLEDVRGSITRLGRSIALILAVMCPARLLERLLGAPGRRGPDDLAGVIFSSGSAGEPKGIMLTHHNISSNIDAVLQVFPHEKGDCVAGILPFFHSFGFTATLWLPLCRGFQVIYHPNPLDAKTIGRLVHEYRCRFLFATPTFLQHYIRRCLPEEFGSLRYVVTGAEKLAERVREAFKTKFGIEPLEGYGATECAPVVSVNVPDFRAAGFFQVGHKPGTIGHPLPGVCVRIVDPETMQPLPQGQPGLLLVKGPNIMKGYLGMPEKTASVLKDGWYDTGDIASQDEDGFLTITDRLARFSKIGGEMIPHTKVEETLHSLAGLTEQSLVVVGVPDESKGERLVALHTLSDVQLDELLKKLPESGLPNLWRPKPGAFYGIGEIPMLGSGKIDLQKLKALAKELDKGE